ncbi:MAG: hypothetical protein WA294_21825 [Acidobacteriaceae bacterium]
MKAARLSNLKRFLSHAQPRQRVVIQLRESVPIRGIVWGARQCRCQRVADRSQFPVTIRQNALGLPLCGPRCIALGTLPCCFLSLFRRVGRPREQVTQLQTSG